CHGVVYSHRHQGVIESLNFPNNYPANGLCSWTIQASTGNTINYTFNAFQLEATSSCSFDYIKLYNGPDEQAPLIGAFCGNTPPPASSTTGSALTVVFRSDSSISMAGFQMMWYQNGCGGDLHGPSGSISSPGYPNKYPENRECIWYVTTSPGSSITMTIHEFDVEFHADCNYDVLEDFGDDADALGLQPAVGTVLLNKRPIKGKDLNDFWNRCMSDNLMHMGKSVRFTLSVDSSVSALKIKGKFTR
ncbi:PREDICTED: cubilin-like, partial [Cyprinodon variegatus]|uniref:cubilin-like n=1 Tax=Cyprinodon variegatus TaxID=28743 RepID=UPI0007429A39